MRQVFFFAYLLAASIASANAGEVAVIVNKANSQAIDGDWVAKVYLGEVKSWVSGDSIVAYDLPEADPTRASFSKSILKRTVANMKVLWAQYTFSGKAVPPKQLASSEEVKKAVANNVHAIGYIDAVHVDSSVRIVTP